MNNKMIIGDVGIGKDVADFWKDKMPIMVMEEAGELIQAISKVERKRPNARENLCEEIRDMYISLAALINHYEIDGDLINFMVKTKLNKKY